MDDNKLFLLDAYALIYRAYYALIRSPRVTSRGFNTSAIFGFCNTLDEILKKENPSHIAACFDPRGGHTFRHEIFPEYKAQREAQPEDITLSVPYIKKILSAYDIPVIEVENYEADDVIGTLSRKAQDEGFTTYMMTPDKDYGQLVTDHIFIYRPSLKGQGFEIRGPKEVCERYGIARPEQIIDLLALEGDASDNIPGCPGVGEKTAVKLISQFNDVEQLLANTDRIKGTLRNKIEDNSQQILLSKQLATICTDIPIDIDFQDLRRSAIKVDELKDIYTELEFKSFLKKLSADEPAIPSPVPSTPSLFEMIDNADEVPETTLSTKTTQAITSEQIGAIVERALTKHEVGISIYAIGEEAMNADIKAMALALPDEETDYYIPIPADTQKRQLWSTIVEPLFNTPTLTVVSHEIKRDMIVLQRLGIDFSAPYYDTAVAHYLLQPEMRHRLRDLAFSHLKVTLPDPSPGKIPKPYPEIAHETAEILFPMQARTVLMLKDIFNTELKNIGLENLLYDLEFPFTRVLAEMEWTGVRIDTHELAELSRNLTGQVDKLRSEIYDIAGHEFNIGSPRQVGEVLFEELKIDPKAKRTKSGTYSTSEEILEKYRSKSRIVNLILEIRGLNKLLTTYINALPAMVNPVTGKLHTTYNQTVTATGRISSSNPNLQNIPVRTDLGREIRRAFIPDKGCVLMAADYSQIELRLMADLSADPDMVHAFAEGKDIHTATAAKIYGVSLDQVSPDLRRNAKTANFGIIYGISAFGLAERLGIPRTEAKMLIDGYFNTYPHIRDYINSAIEKARANGFVTTVMNRRRYLPDINSRNAVVRAYAERNAVNAPLQGSAADIIKTAMIRIDNAIKHAGLKSRMILQVHDELVFNVYPRELPQLQQIVVKEMENAYNGNVRLEVSVGVADNWLEAH